MTEFIQNELPFEDAMVLNDSELTRISSEDELTYYDMVNFNPDEYISLIQKINKQVKSLTGLKRRDISEAHTRYELIYDVLKRIVSSNYRLYSEKILPGSKKRADIVIETLDGDIACVIECKRLNNKLGLPEVHQLQEYMGISRCKSGILTNGEEYRVFYCSDYWVFNIKDLVYAKEFERFLNAISKGIVDNLTRI